jgi:hypothetical protein
MKRCDQDVRISSESFAPRHPWVKRGLSVLLLCAVVTSVGAAQSTPATTLRLRGTIEKCDPTAQTLSVATSKGDTVQFVVPSTTRIRQGGRPIDLSGLEKLVGYRADVHYWQSGGSKTAESVHVIGKAKG